MNLIGTVVDRYQVEAQLGQGSYGAVYRARHTVLDTQVALKVLWPDKADDPKNVERFLREARAAASIGNERIARVVDAGTTADGVVFLALELLDGQDLSEVLKARGRLSVEQTVRLMVQVLDGLGAAHKQGIVHRDLKPANVFVTRTGDIKILDFGISKILGAESLTERGMALGTPRFMAPEQLSGSRVDARADLYAVGVMIYQMLSGGWPYEGAGYELIVRRVKGEAPVPLGSRVPVPAVLEEVVHRALSNEAADRFPTAGSLRRALEAALRGERTEERTDGLTMNPSVSPLSGPVPSSHAAEPTARVRQHPTAEATAQLAAGALPGSVPSMTGSRPAPARSTSASIPSSPGARAQESPRHPESLPPATAAGRGGSTAFASPIRGPAWGWAAIAGLAVLFSLAVGIFGVLAWRVGTRKETSPVASTAPAPVASPSLLVPSPTPPVPVPSASAPAYAATGALPPAPDPSLVEFEIHSNFGTDAILSQHLDARRSAFAECAIDRPAQVPLMIRIGPVNVYATEHSGYSSTAPSATQCVINAATSGDRPREDGYGRVFVRIPAREHLVPSAAAAPSAPDAPSPDLSQVRFEYFAWNYGNESVLREYVEARRAHFAACAVASPTEVRMMASIGPTQRSVSEMGTGNSTAPAAARCVIDVMQTGDMPTEQVIARFGVHLPAGGG